MLTDARTSAFQQWRNNGIRKALLEDLRTPEAFDRAGATVKPSTVEDKVLISSSLNQFIDWLAEYKAMGIDRAFLHNVNRNQEEFIEAFGDHVLPVFA